MENFYLLFVIVLIVLSFSYLIAGVSIDALSFLNSIFPRKSKRSWTIFGTIGLGILLGVTFSGGMLEITRNGIFNPEQFSFSEVISIFLAVIIAGIFTRNIFNILNLPLSTTVTVIFGLIGASFIASLIEIKKAGVLLSELSLYLNTSKLLAIIFGILSSIVMAFLFGFLIQWIIRFTFTFHYQRKIRYIGSILGGITFYLLTFFVLNEMKNTAWMSQRVLFVLQNNFSMILVVSFVVWTILFQLVQLIWKRLNVLRIAVAAATFALAFSFASNDLVNFLGIPVAGIESYRIWHESGISSGNIFTMDFLNGPVQGANMLLPIAGVVILLSIINYRKIRFFNFMTEENPRQTDAAERQGYFPVSRSIIRGSIMMSGRIGKFISPGIKNWINQRFDQSEIDNQSPDELTTDNLRILNILIFSSALIYAGTMLKLPLSTAYVTFMVALGTSLADRKWDREYAVYKVSGIISLIGSWFFNAVTVFILAVVIGALIISGGLIIALILGLIAFLSILRSKIIRRNREPVIQETEEFPELSVRAESVLMKTNQDTSNAIIMISKAYFLGFTGFHLENKEQLCEIDAEIEEFNQRMRKLKANIFKVIQKLQQDSIETGHYYVQIIDYLREMAHSIRFVVRPLYEHLGNNHKPFSEDQNDELIHFSTQVTDFLNFALHIIKESRFDLLDELIAKRQDILETMLEQERRQIRRIKKKETNSRNSVLYFTLMSESKNLLLQTVNLLKATRDFVSYTKSAT